MNKFVIVGAFIALTGLSACSSVAPLKKSAISAGSRIGLVVSDFPQELTHTYIGTTIFNNAEDKYPVSFNVAEYVSKSAEESLLKRGFSARVLDLKGPELIDAKKIVQVSTWDGSLSLSPSANNILGALKDKYGVESIIFYSSSDGSVNLPPDKKFKVANYGLFSRGMFGMKYSMAFANIRSFSVKTSVPVINSFGKLFGTKSMPDFALDDNYKRGLGSRVQSKRVDF